MKTMKYRITTQRELRREFWSTFPDLNRKRIPDYSGHGKMYITDTRVAWIDWIDCMVKDQYISPELGARATL